MKRRRSVPLLALRAFEASAQMLSFTLAAELLGVTQSAVSRHVKHLEDFLGKPLFRRRTRSLELTSAGHALLPRLTRAFDLIDETLHELEVATEGHLTTISMPPTFAVRLGSNAVCRFQRVRPTADVRLRVNTAATDPQDENIDIMIEFLHAAEARHSQMLLFTERLLPICSPEIAKAFKQCPFEEAIEEVALLHVAQRADTYMDWRIWLDGAQLENIHHSRGLIFDTADMTLDAALTGAGVAIADPMYVQQYLDAGVLIAPHGYVHLSGRGYFISKRSDASLSDVATALYQWFVDGHWQD